MYRSLQGVDLSDPKSSVLCLSCGFNTQSRAAEYFLGVPWDLKVLQGKYTSVFLTVSLKI